MPAAPPLVVAPVPDVPRDVPPNLDVIEARALAPSLPELPVVDEPDAHAAAATPAAARLGSEGLLRLRARHAEVLARIAEKITDPVQREQLKADAERLNPDTWVTEAEVTAGLEAYETVFDSLRGVIGSRRKRRRRRPDGPDRPGAATAPEDGAPTVPEDEAAGDR